MDWIDEGNLRWAWWAWETYCAYRRHGVMAMVQGGAHWFEDWCERIHSEETVKAMAAKGVTGAITHFYKGFGLKHEKKEMEQTKRLVNLCHKHGIKVFGYTQFGSIFYETLFDEAPESVKWLQVRQHGELRQYHNAYFRAMPCVNQKGFIAYLKKCVAYGIKHVGLDGLHFDNSYAMPCYCKTCHKAFRTYLTNKFPVPHERFGISSFKHVRIPPEENLAGPIQDPLVQEWIRFRVERLSEVIGELRAYAKKLKPNVALLFNPCFFRSFTNYAAQRSTYAYSFGKQADLIFAENGNFPRVVNNILIHQLEAFKLGQAVGFKVIPTTWLRSEKGTPHLVTDEKQVRLYLAESAAFGGIAGTNWALRPTKRGRGFAVEDARLARPLAEYLHFMEKHREIYHGARSISQIALLYSFPSITFNFENSYGSFRRTEQALIQQHCPFDIVFSEEMEQIRKYPLLILANTVCLSDQEVQSIREYVKDGGALIVKGESGQADENFGERKAGAFAGLRNHPRVIYLPEITEKKTTESHTLLEKLLGNATLVKFPSDAETIARAVRKLLGASEFIRIQAPKTVIADLRSSSSGLKCIHLVNCCNEEIVRGIKISLSSAMAGNAAAVYVSPDDQRAIALKMVKNGGRYNLAAPPVSTYGIIILKPKNK